MDDIASCIKRIYLNIDHINGLHDTSLTSINEQQWKKTSNELEQYEDQTSTMNTSIKNRIKALEASNANHKKNSDLNIRQAQVSAWVKKRGAKT